MALREQGDLSEAARYYRQVLLHDAGNAAAHYNLGNVLREQGLWAEAAQCYQQALAISPGLADAHNNLGIIFSNQGEWAEAILSYRQALLINPEHAPAHNNLGNLFEDQGELSLAVESYRKAVAIDPRHAEAHHNLSVALTHLGLRAEALEHNQHSLSIQPAHAPALWQRSLLRLLAGNFEGGWQDYEQRWALPETAPRSFPEPRWDGSLFAGKTMLVFAEQGLGDTIQFARYLPLVKERGGTVLFECPSALTALCARLDGVDQVTTRCAPLPPFDVQAPLLSLPGIFGTTLATIPAAVPYVRADEQRAEHWRRQLEPLEGFKVGIAWQGRPTHKSDRFRSVPLSSFETLARVEGVRLLSLQVGAGAEQVATASFPVIDLGSRFDQGSFEDLAAVLANLDLVVTVDSAVAHLAGALARPVWVGLPLAPDWRWLLERADSPWYPTMRLFRQSRLGEWSDVFDRIGADLREMLYRQDLDADPTRADVHTHLGMALHAAGRRPEALAHFAQAVNASPDQAEAHVNLGNALKEQGRLDDAANCYHEALRIDPALPQAHNNLGNVFRDQGRSAEAAECYLQALRLQPQYANAYFNLGMALKDQGRLQGAVECFRQALAINPQIASGYYYLGNALKDQAKAGEAIVCYRQALSIDPNLANAHHNLGTLLTDHGELAEAAFCFRQALRIDPCHVDAHSNLGVLLYKQGLYAESAAEFDEALRLDPHHAGARFNRAMLWLATGDFAKGWRDYEFRESQPGAERRAFTQPRWQGEPLDGRTILLYAEQGMGDTVQFIRYASMVKARGGTVLFESQPALLRLLEGVAGIDAVLPRHQELPEFDVQAPLLSLPGILHTTLDTIPASIPYLRVSPDRVAHWRQELAVIPKMTRAPGAPAKAFFKIGIAWQGNPKNRDDSYRSLPLSEFESLAQVEGIRLVSLQVGAGIEQVPAARFPITDLGSRFDPHSLEDLAAVLMNLDLVITVDSIVAHVAGALGVPVWVLLHFAADWRWLLERTDSPWYPSMRLFRQPRPGAWPEVLKRVSEELQALKPQHVSTALRLSIACTQSGHVQEALEHVERTLRINPAHETALCQRALLRLLNGDFEAAWQDYERVVQLNPTNNAVRWSRSLLRLASGDFERGWQEYEYRWTQPGFMPPCPDGPRWDGSALEGKTIFLHAEQGLGDTIQFIRYAALVKERGGTVLFGCQGPLVQLCTGSAGVDQLIAPGTEVPPFDVQAALLSLPGIFGTTLETIPANVPYLHADPLLVKRWKQELTRAEGFQVGIAWQGSPKFKANGYRSAPLARFEPLARLKEVRLLSLQVGPGAKELPAAHFPVTDLGSRFAPNSLADLAAVLMTLDLVVTVDTAVAHLAGALGVPAWVLLSVSPDWRWLRERADSPWYPTMRLFRQKRLGDWDEVLERVAAELRALIERRPSFSQGQG